MLVGTSNVNEVQLIKSCKSYERYCEYCDSLVPDAYKHRQDILMNQRYYCALIIRKSNALSWGVKKDLINTIMEHNKATGLTSAVLEVGLLTDYIDEKKMKRYDRRFNK